MRVHAIRESKRCARKSAIHRRSPVRTALRGRLQPEEGDSGRLQDQAEYEQIIHHFESVHDAALAADRYDS